MRRKLALLAILTGWLSIAAGGIAGVVVSQGFGVNWVEGPPPPMDVYGIKGIYVLWLLVSAAILTAQPLMMATFAPDPRRKLYALAAALGVPAFAMLPSDLGRAFGMPVIMGAAALVLAAVLLEDAARVAVAATPDRTIDGSGAAGLPPAEPIRGGPAPVSGPAPSRRPVSGKAKAPAFCPWCSATVTARAATCPSCGATLDSGRPDDSAPIPGVTEVPPALRAYEARPARKKASILRTMFKDDSVPLDVNMPQPSDQAAVLPPSAEVRAEMARLDAEIATGQAVYGKPEATPKPGTSAGTNPETKSGAKPEA